MIFSTNVVYRMRYMNNRINEREREREREVHLSCGYEQIRTTAVKLWIKYQHPLHYGHCILKRDLVIWHVQSLETPHNSICCTATFSSHCSNFSLWRSKTVQLRRKPLVWTELETRVNPSCSFAACVMLSIMNWFKLTLITNTSAKITQLHTHMVSHLCCSVLLNQTLVRFPPWCFHLCRCEHSNQTRAQTETGWDLSKDVVSVS